MKIIAYTPHGIFESDEEEYVESTFEELSTFLERLHQLNSVSFETANGKFYMSKEMVAQSVFILEK
jgi:hypothetical protein